jgi:hypothetical protein
VRELGGAHLVGASCDRNRADGGEVRLAWGGRRVYDFGTRFRGALAVGEGRYDLRYRLRDPKLNFDFICSMMRFSSSESQISACPPSENSFESKIG